MRISHSHFLGGPAVWTPLDQDKALAHRRRQLERCSGCGTVHSDWFEQELDGAGQPVFDDDTGEPVMRPRNPPPYEAMAERCPGGAAVGRLQVVHENQARIDGGDLRGMRYYLQRLVVEADDEATP